VGQLLGNSSSAEDSKRSIWTIEEKDMFVKGMVGFIRFCIAAFYFHPQK